MPAGAGYYDWWAPSADALAGGSVVTGYDATDPKVVPLFVRSGAIVPMNVSDDVTGIGDAASAGETTALVYPDPAQSSFDLIEDDEMKTTISAKSAGLGFSITLSRVLHDTLLRVRADSIAVVKAGATPLVEAPTRAALDAAASGFLKDAATRSVWVKIQAGAGTTIEGS